MKRKYITLLLLIPVLYGYLAFFSNALTDDAFITLQYVKTLTGSGTWGFYPGDVVNAVTSPLNIFLLSLAASVFGPTVNAVLWLSAFILAGTVLLLAELSLQLFEIELFGYLAATALIFNPLLISTLGLESLLFVALYVLCTYLYVNQSWWWLGVALGLLTLTRFDGVLFFLVALLLLPSFKHIVRLSAAYALTIAPWYLFSWIYFGSIVPDTFFIKVAQRSWGTWEFLNGIGLYFPIYKVQIVLSLLLLPLCFLLFNKQLRSFPAIQFLLLTSVAHYIGYSLLHVPPYYWYYAPEIASIILIGSLGLGQWFSQNHLDQHKKVGAGGVAAAIILLQAAGMFYFIFNNHFSVHEMPIHTNWGTHEDYKAIGEWLNANTSGDTILVDGEVGTLGYYCDCRLSSFFSDRKWLRLYATRKLSETGIQAAPYRVNFLFFDHDENSAQPAYLLQQIPDSTAGDGSDLMRWDLSTKWTSRTLVRLTRYSP